MGCGCGAATRWATSPVRSAPTAACSRSAGKRAVSGCSTCGPGRFGRSGADTRLRAQGDLHARWRHARDFRERRRGNRLGRRPRQGRRALHRPQRGGVGARRDGGWTHARHLRHRRARDRLGPRRGQEARPALHGRRPARHEHSRGVVRRDVTRGLAVSPDGSTLAVTRQRRSGRPHRRRTLRRRRTIQAMQGFAGNVAFSPDGRLLAVAGRNGRITLWNARTLRSAGELRGLRADAQALAFSPDGRFLAAAEALFTPPRIRVWDVRRRELDSLPERGEAPGTLAFSPDGRLGRRGDGIRSRDPGRPQRQTGEVGRARGSARARWRSHPTAAAS